MPKGPPLHSVAGHCMGGDARGKNVKEKDGASGQGMCSPAPRRATASPRHRTLGKSKICREEEKEEGEGRGEKRV